MVFVSMKGKGVGCIPRAPVENVLTFIEASEVGYPHIQSAAEGWEVPMHFAEAEAFGQTLIQIACAVCVFALLFFLCQHLWCLPLSMPLSLPPSRLSSRLSADSLSLSPRCLVFHRHASHLIRPLFPPHSPSAPSHTPTSFFLAPPLASPLCLLSFAQTSLLPLLASCSLDSALSSHLASPPTLSNLHVLPRRPCSCPPLFPHVLKSSVVSVTEILACVRSP